MNSTAETVQVETAQVTPAESTKPRKPAKSKPAAKKPTTKAKPTTKQKQTKSSAKEEKPTTTAKPAKPEVKPKAARAESFAAWMDGLLERERDATKLQAALEAEAKKRGTKNPGLGGLRSHLRFRQARGHLRDVSLPETSSK